MKNIFSQDYLKRLAIWAWRGIWYFLSLLAVLITSLYVLGLCEWYPKQVSTIFSVVGTIILLNQLNREAKKYADGKPNTLPNWIKSFPSLKPIAGSLQGVSLGPATLKARGRLSISPNVSLENKVDFLVNQLNAVQDILDKHDDQFDNLHSEITRNTNSLNIALKEQDELLKSSIVDHIIGDFDQIFFGLVVQSAEH